METTKATTQGNWADVLKQEKSVHSVLIVLIYRKAEEWEYGVVGIIKP